MAVVVKDSFFARSVMVLCLGTAALLVASQWRSGDARPEALPESSPTAASLPAAPLEVPADGPELVVDLSERRVYLYQNQVRIRSYPVAIGQEGWETPTGVFQVQRMQRNPRWRHPITGEVIPPGDRNPLGRHWIGFYSAGRTQIGFHGTYQEDLIGQAVSHGCLRMRNRDVEALFHEVSVGTPVIVRP